MRFDSHRRWRRQYFALAAELIYAMIIMGLVGMIFATNMATLRRAHRGFVQESRAVLALGNVVERLAAMPTITEAQARAILEDEFAKAGIPRQDQLRSALESHPDHWVLAIVKENGKPAAKIEVSR